MAKVRNDNDDDRRPLTRTGGARPARVLIRARLSICPDTAIVLESYVLHGFGNEPSAATTKTTNGPAKLLIHVPLSISTETATDL